jgi:hypothetical protein
MFIGMAIYCWSWWWNDAGRLDERCSSAPFGTARLRLLRGRMCHGVVFRRPAQSAGRAEQNKKQNTYRAIMILTSVEAGIGS